METITKRSAGTTIDICTTCNHVDDCIPSQANGRAIWFCELFDDHVRIQKKTSFTFPKSILSKVDNDRYMGLCVNCDNRKTCLNARTPGGIWHCEEYL